MLPWEKVRIVVMSRRDEVGCSGKYSEKLLLLFHKMVVTLLQAAVVLKCFAVALEFQAPALLNLKIKIPA